MNRLAAALFAMILLCGCTVNAEDSSEIYYATVISTDENETTLVITESLDSEETGEYTAGEQLTYENDNIIIFQDEESESSQTLQETDRILVACRGRKAVIQMIEEESSENESEEAVHENAAAEEAPKARTEEEKTDDMHAAEADNAPAGMNP